jgi:curved DNA-binding protein CbpA
VLLRAQNPQLRYDTGLIGTNMNTEKDYYSILGVAPSIDDVALAAVYRALLKKYHPDVFIGSKAEAELRTRNH